MWIFAFQINLGAKMGIFRCRDCPAQHGTCHNRRSYRSNHSPDTWDSPRVTSSRVDSPSFMGPDDRVRRVE